MGNTSGKVAAQLGGGRQGRVRRERCRGHCFMRQLMRMEGISQVLESVKRFRGREKGSYDCATFLQLRMSRIAATLLISIAMCWHTVTPAAAAARPPRNDAPGQASELFKEGCGCSTQWQLYSHFSNVQFDSVVESTLPWRSIPT